MLPRSFYLLLNETELASMSLCAGMTALNKASTTQKAYYNQFLFSFSIGFERLVKVVHLMSYAVEHHGEFPDNKFLKNMRHNIISSVVNLKDIYFKFGAELKYESMMNEHIALKILEVISEFAVGGRYYNLNELTNGSRYEDPRNRWVAEVGRLVMERHRMRKSKFNYEEFYAKAESISSVFSFAENGKMIDSMASLGNSHRTTAHINKYAARYVVALVQNLTALLEKIQCEAHRNGLQVPYFNEFFLDFNAPAEYWRNKKCWSL